MHDYILGPYDQTTKPANLPILTNIVGLAFGWGSPFQAEIYFINISGNVQIKFGIPNFEMYDPRFIDLGVPCNVRVMITFNITDYKNFIKLNRLINFELENFKKQIKDSFTRKTKSVVLNISQKTNIPLMQIERQIDEISGIIQNKLSTELNVDFGVNLKRIEISSIELDKENPHYLQLKKMTADQQTKFTEEKTDIEMKNLSETMCSAEILNWVLKG